MNIKLCDSDSNARRAVEMACSALDMGAGMLVLPELFLTGFCYQPGASDQPPFPSLDPFRELARDRDCIIIGSIMSGRRNLGFVLERDKEDFRAKVHPFGPEKAHFDGGDCIRPIDTRRGKIGLEICYDLRFPEVARSLTLQGADLLVTVAEFPLVRRDHWRALAVARAIENQIPHMACNAAGPEFCGSSMIIGAWGEVLAEAGPVEEIVPGEVDMVERDRIRREIPCLEDRRPELY